MLFYLPHRLGLAFGLLFLAKAQALATQRSVYAVRAYEALSKLRRINSSDVMAYNADAEYASIITGVLGHSVEDIRLTNIRIYYRGSGTAEQAGRLIPDPLMLSPAPANGFYIRHAKGVKMTNVEVSYLSPEARPAFMLDDVQGASLHALTAQKSPASQVLTLKNVAGFQLHLSLGLPDTQLTKATSKTWYSTVC